MKVVSVGTVTSSRVTVPTDRSTATLARKGVTNELQASIDSKQGNRKICQRLFG